MTIVGMLAAALLIATMSGVLMAGPDRDAVDLPSVRSPLATGGSLAEAAPDKPVQLAQAVFVRRDVVNQDSIVVDPTIVRDGVGGRVTAQRASDGGTLFIRPSRERYWSRADAVPATASHCDPADRVCLD